MENDRLQLSYVDNISGKEPTKRQLEVLLLLNPFEKKTNYAEVARTLGISRAAVQQRMCHLKKRCPSIYKKFWDLRKAMNDRNHKRSLAKPWLFDPKFLEDACDGERLYGTDSLDLRIKETF